MAMAKESLNPDVTKIVLDAARGLYARQGYLTTTIKGVAATSGVAPDLIRRYYANREELFAAAMQLPFEPGTAITRILAPGIDGLGERLVRVTLEMFDDPEVRNQIRVMVRDAASAAKMITTLREFLETAIIDPVAAALRVPDARMRVALATSYLIGAACVGVAGGGGADGGAGGAVGADSLVVAFGRLARISVIAWRGGPGLPPAVGSSPR
jgi:AcrR family transcriptional regulator